MDRTLEQTQWDHFWLPSDATVVDRPELLFWFSPRPLQYLNMVTRTRAEASRLPALVAEVAHAHRHASSRWAVTPGNHREALERALSDGGYAPGHVHIASSIAVDAHARPIPEDIVVRRVETMAQLLDWLLAHEGAFGQPPSREPEHLARELAGCVDPCGRVHRFVAYDAANDEPLSSAGLTAHPRLDFGFLWAGGTRPEARGRGAYTAVVAARVACARHLGLSRVGLYARTTTSAPIVARQGFEQHGRMTYWTRPPASDPGDAVTA